MISSLLTTTIITLIAAFVFGNLIGSFLNVLIWRLPQDKKITGRSHCAHCNHVLTARDLIPVISFALARGRCRYCQAKVSPRYPIIEIITGLLFAAVAYKFLLLFLPQFWPLLESWQIVWYLLLLQAVLVVCICLVVFVIDFEHYLILDKIVFPSFAVFTAILIAASLLSNQPVQIFVNLLCAVGAALPFAAIWYFSKGKWMGYGDVKFIALMGLMLGWPNILIALFIAFMLGAFVGVGLIATGRKNLSSKLPFGTFLAVATVLALFFGTAIWNGYWGLFGG